MKALALDTDGRPAISGADPLLERLIKVHKAPRLDLYWQPRTIYEQAHPETRRGSAGGRAKNNGSSGRANGQNGRQYSAADTFAKKAAKATVRSERTVRLASKRGTGGRNEGHVSNVPRITKVQGRGGQNGRHVGADTVHPPRRTDTSPRPQEARS